MDVRSIPKQSAARDSGSVVELFVQRAPQRALAEFERYGNYLNAGGSPLQALVDGLSGPAGAASIADDALRLATRAGRALNIETPAEFGLLGKTLGKVGSVCDAVLGVGELAQAYARDQQESNFASRMHLGFLGKSIEVTARIAAGNIVGSAVCAGAIALTGATVTPILLGVAAGAATAYCVGRIASMTRALFR